ncbi:ParA family protein [Neisseria sp. Ec49-e6-T10]|uniref:ParA family protein n=1 Tax=Neisseria sp. Ec49-e6-T10 TaxID=3140744 RepID=UPI003EBFFE2D
MVAFILAIANQKGGVGKTTTAVNLAASLAKKGKRVLVVDLDPQGNATMGSGINKGNIKHGVYHVLLGEHSVKEVLLKSPTGEFDVLAANRNLAGAEIELVQEIAREMRLKSALDEVKEQYDFIILDCPPSLTLLTLNGLVAADGVIVPMVCEYYALEGLSDLVSTLRKIRQTINPKVDILGVLKTMFDARSNLAQDVAKQLESHFSKELFETDIPRNVRLAEAPSHGMPALVYDAHAKGAIAYLSLADEVIKRVQQKQKSK